MSGRAEVTMVMKRSLPERWGGTVTPVLTLDTARVQKVMLKMMPHQTIELQAKKINKWMLPVRCQCPLCIRQTPAGYVT